MEESSNTSQFYTGLRLIRKENVVKIFIEIRADF